MNLELEYLISNIWTAPKPRLYTITWVQNCQEFKKEHCSDKEVKDFITGCSLDNAYLGDGGKVTGITITSEDWEAI